MTEELIERNLRHIWHPCSQMKDYIDFPPLAVHKAYGPYLELIDGRKIIDAFSSWWCKTLGHGHPELKNALTKQLDYFEHVILANTTNLVIVELSERLAALTANLNKVFYASDGSCAVEIAMKMSLHSRKITGENKRQYFMALSNSYHGETGLALSVSDLGLYGDPYRSVLPKNFFLQNIPYVKNKNDPLWNDCSAAWPNIEKQLEEHADKLTAVIVEPIVQGAGGMLIYSQDFLRRLRNWTHKNNIHLIADEIMSGLGRTGFPLACQHAEITPDFICLGKNLTGGFIPMSAVLTHDKIYELFYDDYEMGKSFLHSHTFSGNALAASVANTTLTILQRDNIYQQVQERENLYKQLMDEIADNTGKLINVRNIGAIVAADLITNNSKQRLGYKVYQQAVKLGALLRPLGNTIYWLPPLNIETEVLYQLQDITQKAIIAVC